MELRKARLLTLLFLLAGIPLRAADITKAEEQKAAKDVSNEADKWVASQPSVTPPPVTPAEAQPAKMPAATPTTPATTPAATEAVSKPVEPVQSSPATVKAPANPTKSPYNEMTGKIMEISEDPDVLRITLENGYNVEFSYDKDTIMTNGGGHITIDDLTYGDEVQIHYLGKELRAVDLERIRKAPRPVLGQ